MKAFSFLAHKIKNHENKIFKLLVIFCLIVIFVQLFLISFYRRDSLLTPYDITYWTERVEHSRYMLPLSNRSIGDNGFYAYGGYKIIEGDDPTKTVFDKPALGLFFLGIFSHWLNNPSYSGVFFGIGSILLIYVIAYKLTGRKLYGLLTATLLLLDPSIVFNFTTSLLDLPQVFFLLTNIALLLYVKDSSLKAKILIFFAAVCLGIFAQIKIPVIYPFIFLLEVFFLGKKFGKILVIFYILGTLVSVGIGYIFYFLHGYSFIEFAKIQKYILSFYTSSKLPLHPEAMWQFLFFGNFPDVSSGKLTSISEWSLVYPLMTLVSIIVAAKTILRKGQHYMYYVLSIILLLSLMIFTVIPTYPRYILIILPFFYIYLVTFLFDKKYILGLITFFILALYSLVNTFLYFQQSPASFLSLFYDNFTRQYYQDIYEEQATESIKMNNSREQFLLMSNKILSDAKIKKISISEGKYEYSVFADSVTVPVTITYQTEYLGQFSEQKYLKLRKENSTWKIDWSWEYLLNGYNTGSSIESKRIVGKRGALIDNKGGVLASDTQGYLVSFNPFLMKSDQETRMLELLASMSTLPKVVIQNAYLENPPRDTYIPLFTTTQLPSEGELNELRSYSGIKIEPYQTRHYTLLSPKAIKNTQFDECCTRIYSSFNYHGVEGVEKDYERQLLGYDGGSLLLYDETGKLKRTIIKKEKKDGSDVVLPKVQ